MEEHENKDQFGKGQSLLEFAFSLLFFFILLAGIVDIGRAFFTYMALHDAAQEGALYGSIYPSDINGIRQRVQETAQHPIDLYQTDIDIDTGNACENETVIVSVGYNFPITMPFIGTLIGSQELYFSATARDTILRPPCP